LPTFIRLRQTSARLLFYILAQNYNIARGDLNCDLWFNNLLPLQGFAKIFSIAVIKGGMSPETICQTTSKSMS
jgi:hypothetical protein